MKGLTLNNLMNIRISGTGIGFPGRGKWTGNEAIHAAIFGEHWIEKMAAKKLDPQYYINELGFKQRYWVHTPGQPVTHDELTAADLMVEAAERAIADSGLSKTDIDFVIAVTITSPRYTTSMGAFVGGKLGITAPAIEMKSGCASNIFSFVMAAQLIQSGARHVLITCGETTSKIIKPNSNMMYAGGDGGAAVIVSRCDNNKKGIAAAYLNTNGAFCGFMGVNGMLPPNQKDLDEGNYLLTYNDGSEEFLQQAWDEIPSILYNASGLTAADINCLIPHQVYKKRTLSASKAAGIPADKTVNIIEQYANCGPASLLLALHHAFKDGLLQEGGTAMLVAAGGGISWGGIILKN